MMLERIGAGFARYRVVLRIIATVGLVLMIRYGFDGTWLSSILIPLVSVGITESDRLFGRRDKRNGPKPP